MDTYEIKLKCMKEAAEDGILKNQKMKYIVTDAITCGNAEECAMVHANKEAGALDIECVSVQAKGIFDFFNKDADRLWYVKVQQIVVDDLSGKEHRVSQLYVVGADSAKEASNTIMYELAGMDCEVVKISDSKVDYVISSIVK